MKANTYEIAMLMLTKNGSTFTYDQIAENCGLSNKTIRNYMKEIDRFLSQYNLKTVKQAGLGIYIDGSEQDRAACYQDCLKKSKSNRQLNSHLRKNIILFSLLTSSTPIRMNTLEKLLFITRPSIYHDLSELDIYCSRFDIKINRSKTRGIYLDAGEKRRRYCLVDLSYQLKSENIDDYAGYYSLYQFLQIIHSARYEHFLASFIKDIASTVGYSISRENSIRAVLFILVTVYRIKNNFNATLNLDILNKIANIHLYNEIKSRIGILNDKFDVQFNESEVVYISSQLSSYMSSDFNNIYAESRHAEVIMSIIEDFCSILKDLVKPFDRNYLSSQLFPFIEKSMQSTNYNFDIFNPNTETIKSNYKELFQICLLINPVMLKYTGVQFPESGIASITLIMADIQERSISSLRCAYQSDDSGIERNLVSSLLKNAIPNMELTIVSKGTEINPADYDLILTDEKKTDSTQIPICILPDVITQDFLKFIIPLVQDIKNRKRKSFIY